MKIFGIDISVIILAIITSFIGYQFSGRTKKREVFVNELSRSYNEVYFPIYELLKEIIKENDAELQIEKLNTFFQMYSGPESKIKYIGSTLLLESYYELRDHHRNYMLAQSEWSKDELFKKLTKFKEEIEDEFWDAHDIIYENHNQFKAESFQNPFIVITMNIVRYSYYLVTFSVWGSLVMLYLASWSEITKDNLPTWWNIKNSITMLIISILLNICMLSVRSLVIKKNRRKGELFRLFKKIRTNYKLKKVLKEMQATNRANGTKVP